MDGLECDLFALRLPLVIFKELVKVLVLIKTALHTVFVALVDILLKVVLVHCDDVAVRKSVGVGTSLLLIPLRKGSLLVAGGAHVEPTLILATFLGAYCVPTIHSLTSASSFSISSRPLSLLDFEFSFDGAEGIINEVVPFLVQVYHLTHGDLVSIRHLGHRKWTWSYMDATLVLFNAPLDLYYESFSHTLVT